MKLTSSAFMPGGNIPNRYTMYGENLIPALHVEDIPTDARSLALIMDDPDTPQGTFTHWLLFNLDPRTHDFGGDIGPAEAAQGMNDFGRIEYGGPKPPSGEHRYYWKLFALDSRLNLNNGATRDDLEANISGHILASATLMGRYAHQLNPV
jgi:Raf kinase inhibitor-like YbhB/YbcL family protein